MPEDGAARRCRQTMKAEPGRGSLLSRVHKGILTNARLASLYCLPGFICLAILSTTVLGVSELRIMLKPSLAPRPLLSHQPGLITSSLINIRYVIRGHSTILVCRLQFSMIGKAVDGTCVSSNGQAVHQWTKLIINTLDRASRSAPVK